MCIDLCIDLLCFVNFLEQRARLASDFVPVAGSITIDTETYMWY